MKTGIDAIISGTIGSGAYKFALIYRDDVTPKIEVDGLTKEDIKEIHSACEAVIHSRLNP